MYQFQQIEEDASVFYLFSPISLLPFAFLSFFCRKKKVFTSLEAAKRFKIDYERNKELRKLERLNKKIVSKRIIE